jgi:hypothetical protein
LVFGAGGVGALVRLSNAIASPGSLLKVSANCRLDWAVPLHVLDCRPISGNDVPHWLSRGVGRGEVLAPDVVLADHHGRAHLLP